MADRDFVVKWAHLGRGRNPRHRPVPDEQRRLFKEHIAEIQAEQEALDAAREWPASPALRIADRYAAGRPRGTGHDEAADTGRRWPSYANLFTLDVEDSWRS